MAKFATGVVDTGGAPWLANISDNFRKKFEMTQHYFLGLGEDDSWKKPEETNLVTLSFLTNSLSQKELFSDIDGNEKKNELF